MLITIKQSDEDIKKARTLLADMPQRVEKAIAFASNTAIRSARTAGNREVRKTYVGMKAGQINNRIKISKAAVVSFTGKAVVASMYCKGRTIRSINFINRPTTKGIFVRVKKGEGGIIRSSFYAKVNSGVGIFTRSSKDKYPIEMMYGPSMPQMLGNKKVVEAINDRGAEVFETRLAHEVERLLNK